MPLPSANIWFVHIYLETKGKAHCEPLGMNRTCLCPEGDHSPTGNTNSYEMGNASAITVKSWGSVGGILFCQTEPSKRRYFSLRRCPVPSTVRVLNKCVPTPCLPRWPCVLSSLANFGDSYFELTFLPRRGATGGQAPV